MPSDGENVPWENRRIHAANVVFGAARYKPGGLCGPRVQRDFQLGMAKSGDGAVTVDQTIRRLRAGALYKFLPGGHEYFEFSTDKPTRHFWGSVRPGFLPGDFRNRPRRAPFSGPCAALFRVLMSAVLKLRSPRSREARVLIEPLALSVVTEFLNCSRQFEVEPGTDAPVRAFLHYGGDHFMEEDCLPAAHKAAGISHNALISRCRQELHRPPARCLWHSRVERAAAMRGETGHSAAEIAYSCGFKNPFPSSRLMKQQLGVSPKHLRSQVGSWARSAPADMFLASQTFAAAVKTTKRRAVYEDLC